MTLRLALTSWFLFLSFLASAQTYTVTGSVIDLKDTAALPGVTVSLTNTTDSSKKTGTATDADGNFELTANTGQYILRLEYVGYSPVIRTITVADKNVALGTLTMKTKSNELKGVTVKEKQVRAEQNGDTAQFNANAFKTNPDASAEDLVTKMPGVTSDNTGVKVNGENVQQVYVDGKPFFGQDPSLALKNLPAEIIDKIQVFDKLSDQSAFTGFDDGNTQKTMNIITKKGKSEGVFGKVYAGYGTDDRYLAGGNLNIFNGDQRITLLGLSNNINQQNFSSEDLLGLSGSGSGRNRGGSRGGDHGGSGNSSNNFLVGQQGGITTTNSAGINYSDNWGKKIKVSGSYFYNSTDNTNRSLLTRNYFTSPDTTNVYNETNVAETNNFNHRINMRLEYNIDSSNSITFTPGISFQQNNSTNSTSDSNWLANVLYSLSNSRTSANNNGYNSNNNLLIQHKFAKPRRTISLNVSSSFSGKTGDGIYYSQNNFYGDNPSSGLRDQHYNLDNNSYTISPNLSYTEPIGKKSQVMANYNPSYTYSKADKETFDLDTTTNSYSMLNDTFSNKYNNTYITQKGGLSFRIGDRKTNFNIGANVQYATLHGEQQYPVTRTLEKNFTSILPNASYNFRYADGRNLRIMYRTNTQAPSISQLQDILDISNPLLLKTGNAYLKQDYEHTFIVRYGLTKKKTAHNFFFNLYANYITDYIGNSTIAATTPGVYFVDNFNNDTIAIKQGSQLTRPENMDGYFNGRMFMTYGLPAQFIKCNLNLTGGFNYMRVPGRVNTVMNYSDNYVPSAGVVLSSNVSENLDFTLSYFGSYNIVNNTSQTQTNNNYYNHTAALRFNYIFLKHFVFNTNLTESYYTAFSSTGNQEFIQWNAYLGYKFLKNNALEARISAFDILNQNKSINRTVTETYIENNTTEVLKQYFMFQLTYTIRNFKGTMPTEEKDSRPELPKGASQGGGRDRGRD